MKVKFLKTEIQIPFGNTHTHDQFLIKLLEVLPSTARVCEVGCYKGVFTKIMIEKFDPSLCHFYEGDKENYSRMKSQIGSLPNLYNIALYNKNEILKWYSAGAFSSLKMPIVDYHDRVADRYEVQTQTLDQIGKPFDFIKIDAEGSDFNILRGAKNLIQENQPLLYFEFTGRIGGHVHGYSRQDFENFFDEMGYLVLNKQGNVLRGEHWRSDNGGMFNNLLALPNNTAL